MDYNERYELQAGELVPVDGTDIPASTLEIMMRCGLMNLDEAEQTLALRELWEWAVATDENIHPNVSDEFLERGIISEDEFVAQAFKRAWDH